MATKDPIERITALLADPAPDKRAAAAIVLSELEVKSQAAIEKLTALLDDELPRLQRLALEALGRVGAKKALGKIPAAAGQPRRGGARRRDCRGDRVWRRRGTTAEAACSGGRSRRASGARRDSSPSWAAAPLSTLCCRAWRAPTRSRRAQPRASCGSISRMRPQAAHALSAPDRGISTSAAEKSAAARGGSGRRTAHPGTPRGRTRDGGAARPCRRSRRADQRAPGGADRPPFRHRQETGAWACHRSAG